MLRRIMTLTLVGLVVAMMAWPGGPAPKSRAQQASPATERGTATATIPVATETPVPPTETLLATPTYLPPTATPCADAPGCGGGKDAASPAAGVDKPGAGDPVAMADEADNRSLTINGSGYIAQIQFVIDIDTYVFTGTAGTRVVIAAYNYSTDPNFEVTFWLKDPNGAYSQYSQISGYDANGTMHRDALLDAYVLPQTGTYTIGVGLGNGSSTTGSYVVYVSSDTGDRDTLTSGASRSGQIFPTSDRDTYYFSGGRGQVVTIVATKDAGSDLDGFLQLWHRDPADDTWKLLSTDDDSGGSRNPQIASFSLPGSGQFAIMMWAYGNASVGGYSLSLFITGSPQADSEQWVASGLEYQGSVGSHGCDRFFLRLQTGERRTIVARRASGSSLDPKLDLYTWEGVLLTTSDDTADADGDVVRTAYIEVYATQNATAQFYLCDVAYTGGGYVLSITDDSGDKYNFLSGPGVSTRSSTISPQEDRDFFEIYGTTGQWFEISLAATGGGLLPALRLESWNGSSWALVTALGNASGNGSISLPATRVNTTNNYRIVVFSKDMASTGSYDLTLRVLAGAPTSTPTRATSTPTRTPTRATITPTKKPSTNTPTRGAATNTPTRRPATNTPTRRPAGTGTRTR